MGRKWGQHFLVDKKALQTIASAIQLWGKDYEYLLEIGGGEGALTEYLYRINPEKLIVIEIDPQFYELLRSKYPKAKIVNGDALKIDWETLVPEEQQFGIVGNLAYDIANGVVWKMLETKDRVPEAVLMMQREVAVRLLSVGQRTTNWLSVILHLFYKVSRVLDVPPKAFKPPPEVWGTVLRMERLPQPLLNIDIYHARKILTQAFAQRRKQLKNTLKPYANQLPPEVLHKRPEQLSLEEWISVLQAILTKNQT
ncbi:MAG: ribosomal RNA small subunit methyltransferase A [Chlorobi bacterium]|nr:ribosomal RNA small subunit methyltransferase A [Chlorobiota bacterium]